MIFDLTSRPKITQNLKKSRSKNRSVFGIDFGPLFLTFWPPKTSKSGPKCSQNAPNEGTPFDKMLPCDGPGLKMLPKGSEESKSDHFGLQNDLPRLQNRPPNDPWRPTNAPKTIPYHILPRTLNKYRKRQQNFNFTSYTSHVPRPKFQTSHFAHCTLHFTLDSLHSTQPSGLREAIK